ncbi:MAG: hypothetical protein ACRCXC_05000 [Legionella sp.]
MGSKHNAIIQMIARAFIKVLFEAQTDTSKLSRMGEDDKVQPVARLIDTETECSELQDALNRAIAEEPDDKKGALSHLRGQL